MYVNTFKRVDDFSKVLPEWTDEWISRRQTSKEVGEDVPSMHEALGPNS